MIPETDTRLLRILDSAERQGKPVLTSRGTPFEWKRHRFLLEPLCDFHPLQGIRKCAQVGFSEMSILKAFYMAEHLRLNILYTLPSDSFVQDFVPPKANKIIENNPHVFSRITGNTSLKKVGIGMHQRFIYFKGANNPVAASNREETARGTSMSSDINIHDEASKSDPFILNQMESRLSDSQYKGRWLFDNPTYPLQGADYIWDQSDQKHFFVKCGHCGFFQYMDWVRLDKVAFKKRAPHCFVNPDTCQFICSNCAKEITDEDRMNGMWVKKRADITEYRGYWISQLIYVSHSVKTILRSEENPKTSASYFQNFILGKPYVGSDVKIRREDIAACISLDKNSKLNNAMGIDQGITKWYVIGNEEGIFEKGHTDSWEEIEFLMKKYDVVAVSDALPDTGNPIRLARAYSGRFFRAFYKPERDQNLLALFSPKGALDTVLIRRNQMFDHITQKILNKELKITMNINQLDDFIKHWESIVRIVTEDSEMNSRFDWERIGDDHLAHATLYFMTALEKVRSGTATTQRMPKKEPSNKLLHASNKGLNLINK